MKILSRIMLLWLFSILNLAAFDVASIQEFMAFAPDRINTCIYFDLAGLKNAPLANRIIEKNAFVGRFAHEAEAVFEKAGVPREKCCNRVLIFLFKDSAEPSKAKTAFAMISDSTMTESEFERFLKADSEIVTARVLDGKKYFLCSKPSKYIVNRHFMAEYAVMQADGKIISTKEPLLRSILAKPDKISAGMAALVKAAPNDSLFWYIYMPDKSWLKTDHELRDAEYEDNFISVAVSLGFSGPEKQDVVFELNVVFDMENAPSMDPESAAAWIKTLLNQLVVEFQKKHSLERGNEFMESFVIETGKDTMKVSARISGALFEDFLSLLPPIPGGPSDLSELEHQRTTSLPE